MFFGHTTVSVCSARNFDLWHIYEWVVLKVKFPGNGYHFNVELNLLEIWYKVLLNGSNISNSFSVSLVFIGVTPPLNSTMCIEG